MLKKNVKITGVRLILHVAEGRPEMNIRLAYNLTLGYLTVERFSFWKCLKVKCLECLKMENVVEMRLE